MVDFETLGVFYLGRRFDAGTGKTTNELVLYDSKDLVTHGLIVGMTGSGKTGLGVSIIEEAAIDEVPVVVIDPKGDLTNLLLTFPDLTAEDFAPWVSADEAGRSGQSVAALAGEQATKWRKGLGDWGQDGARIARLKAAADFAIYTPGSSVAPVSVLSSFGRPATDEAELLTERAQTIAASVLTLAGIDADPVRGREHILLSTILIAAWQADESPEMGALIERVQKPPMTRVGVMDIDSFFPAKDRFEFAMALNALIASPGFAVWTQGVPLDVAAFLRTSAGQPRVSIFSLAHLDEGQRMFFVTLLLNAMIGWMRGQSGTSSLRAMLYMDEIFGFFPPVANPPSKPPLLTLLKQGRAAGLGVVLATQNPVDLDYKGLSNIGTWWLGRLQTDRDKARVLDGLEGANAGGFDRAEVDRLLSGLTSRVFLMRNVHEDGHTLFHSRWAMSYLRGPLSRDELKRLVQPGSPTSATPSAPASVVPQAQRSVGAGVSASTATQPSSGRPSVPPDVPQYFTGLASASRALTPTIYGAAEVRITDTKAGLDVTRQVALVAGVSDGPVPLDWGTAARVALAPENLQGDPPEGATYEVLPSAAVKAKNYAAWSKQLSTWLGANEALELMKSPSSGEVSHADESERDFRARLQQHGRETRDQAVDELRRTFGPKMAALDEKLRRAKQAVEKESQQASGATLQTVISVGATLASVFLGKRAVSAGTLGRATSAARGVSRSMKEREDIQRAAEGVAALEAQREQLESDLAAEIATIDSSATAVTEKLERVVLKPKRGGVTIKLVALVWQ